MDLFTFMQSKVELPVLGNFPILADFESFEHTTASINLSVMHMLLPPINLRRELLLWMSFNFRHSVCILSNSQHELAFCVLKCGHEELGSFDFQGLNEEKVSCHR